MQRVDVVDRYNHGYMFYYNEVLYAYILHCVFCTSLNYLYVYDYFETNEPSSVQMTFFCLGTILVSLFSLLSLLSFCFTLLCIVRRAKQCLNIRHSNQYCAMLRSISLRRLGTCRETRRRLRANCCIDSLDVGSNYCCQEGCQS